MYHFVVAPWEKWNCRWKDTSKEEQESIAQIKIQNIWLYLQHSDLAQGTDTVECPNWNTSHSLKHNSEI